MKQCLAVMLAGLLGSSSALAQDSRRDDRARPARRPGESRQGGESGRDVSGFTADGKPVSLGALKGDYKVLVFGCLT